MEMVFLPNSMARDFNILSSLKPCPSNDFKVVGDWSRSGEPMLHQQDKDITHVEAPSSITV